MSLSNQTVSGLASLARPLAAAIPALLRGYAAQPAATAGSTSTLFGHVEPAPKDPILGITEKFLADPSPIKMNLGVVSGPWATACFTMSRRAGESSFATSLISLSA